MSAKKKPKQKPMSEAEYIQTFCQEKRIRNRFAAYISPETHRKLMKVVCIFQNDHHVTAMSMAEAILNHHFEVNGELLGRLYNEDMEKSIKLSNGQDNESDNEDESD